MLVLGAAGLDGPPGERTLLLALLGSEEYVVLGRAPCEGVHGACDEPLSGDEKEPYIEGSPIRLGERGSIDECVLVSKDQHLVLKGQRT